MSKPAPVILKKTKLRLQNPYAEVAYTDNDLSNKLIETEDLDTAETAGSDIFVRSNTIKEEILHSLEEKSKDFALQSIPKSSKTEILSEKEDWGTIRLFTYCNV